MANVHRWGADDWMDHNGEVREGEGERREYWVGGGGFGWAWWRWPDLLRAS